jgi:hypothetical protein
VPPTCDARRAFKQPPIEEQAVREKTRLFRRGRASDSARARRHELPVAYAYAYASQYLQRLAVYCGEAMTDLEAAVR